jgi:cytochrome c oxidase subunit 3
MKEVEPERQPESLPREENAATLGMWVFLATETLFVGVLFGAYILVRLNHPEGFTSASRETDIVLGTLNTAVLLTSSLAMALALYRAHEGHHHSAANWLVITALLGLCFLGIKGIEYWMDWQHALVPGLRFHVASAHAQGMELFFFLYFIMTGAHALHLFIGVVLVLLFAGYTRRGRFTQEYQAPLENVGLYWHFVDVVWIFLFPLLYLVHRA